MEKKLDPVRVMPDAVWDQVLNRLDPHTLSVTRSVSRGWSERASRSAMKRDDVPVHASVEQLQAMHGSVLAFLVRFWHLAVFRTTHLFDYVKAHHEVARYRVGVALLASAVLLVLGPPFALKTLWPWGEAAVQTLELALLFLPGFVRLPPRLAGVVLLLLSLLLVRLDAGVLRYAPVAAPLPLVALLVQAVMVWSLFAQRLGVALECANRVPLFFGALSLPFRSLRFVGWLMASVREAPLWLYAACLAAGTLVTIRGRRIAPLPVDVAQFLVVGAGASAVAQFVTWEWDCSVLAKTAIAVALLAWNLSTLPTPWFDRGLLMHARRFRVMGPVTLVAFIALVAWMRLF